MPWKACRSPRGAKKRLSSEGIACSNPECTYFGCSVASVHTMVSCGVRGKTDSIRRWKCQACSTSVSERKHTPLYHLKTPPSASALFCRYWPMASILLPNNERAWSDVGIKTREQIAAQLDAALKQ